MVVVLVSTLAHPVPSQPCPHEIFCREHAEGSLLWDVFYVPDMGARPAAQMCMESAAQQSSFSLQLASQLDQEDRLTIKTLNFLFRCSATHC